MTKDQVKQIMDYLDMEYGGIISRMTTDERRKRNQHWVTEIGSLDFNAAMTAVRKLSREPYMPRTGEVIAEVEKLQEFIDTAERYHRTTCRIYRDAAGHEILELGGRGFESIVGFLSSLPDWMQIKFHWMADPTPANTEAWETYIMEHEKHDKYSYPGMFPEVDLILENI